MSQWKKALFFRRFGSGSRDVPDEEGTERIVAAAAGVGSGGRSRDVPDEEGTESCVLQFTHSTMSPGSRDVPDEEGTESETPRSF